MTLTKETAIQDRGGGSGKGKKKICLIYRYDDGE